MKQASTKRVVKTFRPDDQIVSSHPIMSVYSGMRASERKIQFRSLVTREHAELFREIRLEALRKHPEYFVSGYEEACNKPLSYFEDEMLKNHMIGAFKDEKLLGIIGFHVLGAKKMCHTGRVTGFYIRKEYRGRGFAGKMFELMLDEAEKKLEKIMLVVNAKNKNAIRLYKKFGFKMYAIDEKALKINGCYYDECHMVKFF